MALNESLSTASFNVEVLESWLLDWLARRLQIHPSAIDREDSLNHLGLDSLGATQLASELSRKLGRQLSSVLVWEHPTLAQLVGYLCGDPVEARREAVETVSETTDEAIAIVGLSCRFPSAPNPQEFWELLCAGQDAVGDIPQERWDVDTHFHPDPDHPETMNTRQGAFLDQVDAFDPLFFHISPREAEQMDPQQRLMLELSWEALEDAGIAPGTLAGSASGVFFGAMWRDYADLHRDLGAVTTLHTGPGLAPNIIANRVSYVLDLQGPSLMVDTACSSTLVAVHLACQSLRSGDASLALVGGVSLMISPVTMVQIAKYGGLAEDGRCKTCDQRADGFGRGEGGGVLVLKPLTKALFDGDRIYSVIRSSAVNNDGSSNGLTAPNPRAQVDVLRKAYRGSGVRPEQVDYVEMHGAGTALGDPIETEALSRVFCARRGEDRPLIVGAVKSNLAHLEPASGAPGLIKTSLALHRRQIPPNVHFESCNPNIALERLQLEIPTESMAWPRPDGKANRPPRAGVSAFGWGGTNCHLVLEGLPFTRLPSLAEPATDGGGPLVFVGSPVGSQWSGMGRALIAGEPEFRKAVKACDAAYRELTGRTLLPELARAEDGPRWSQPSFVLASTFFLDVGLAALWRSRGIVPDAVCGHSLGEITASYLAGALTLEDALRVVYQYGRLGEHRHGTGMAIVGRSAAEIERQIGDGEPVWVAGLNSPNNTLLAGDAEALDRLMTSLEPADAFRSRVRYDSAYHCPLLEPQMEEMRNSLAELRPKPATIPLYSTLTGGPVAGPELDGDHWAHHYAKPVDFAGLAGRLLQDGYRRFVELGPHPALQRPMEECFAAHGVDDARAIACLRRDRDPEETLGAALQALADRQVDPSGGTHLVLLSGRTSEALDASARALAEHLRHADPPGLDDLAASTAVRRTHHEYRMALAVESVDEVVDSLDRYLDGQAVPAASVSRTAARRRPRTAFAFSGQGPQWWWARGTELLDREPAFTAMIDRCGEALRQYDAVPDLRQTLLGEAKASVMQRPSLAQPVLLSIQLGLDALWRSWGVVPAVVFGHSFGEIAAAFSAGVLSFDEAVRVAVERGRVMETVFGSGTMASAEISAERAEEICRPYGDRLVLASINGPEMVALSGEVEAIGEVVADLSTQGVGCWPLRVKLPFHSPLMEEAGQALERALEGLEPRDGHCPILSAVTGKLADGHAFGASYWRQNVRRPVRFQPAVMAAAEMGCEAFVEITTQPLLATAMSQCLSIGQGLESLPDQLTVVSAIRAGRESASLLEALGGLHARGVEIDWPQLYPECRPVALPTYPFQRQRYWLAPAASPPVDEVPSTRMESSTTGAAPAAVAPSFPAMSASGTEPSPTGHGTPEVIPTAVPAASVPPDPATQNGAVEAVLDLQLQTFNRLVAQQLAALRGNHS